MTQQTKTDWIGNPLNQVFNFAKKVLNFIETERNESVSYMSS